MTAANAMRSRLRSELSAAMVLRNGGKAKVLRSLIAAIDNAEAVPFLADNPYREKQFGDPSGEVPRKVLSDAEVREILAADADERDKSAKVLRDAGRSDRANELEIEAQFVRDFLHS